MANCKSLLGFALTLLVACAAAGLPKTIVQVITQAPTTVAPIAATTAAPVATTATPVTTTVNPNIVKVPSQITFDVNVTSMDVKKGSADYDTLMKSYLYLLKAEFLERKALGFEGIDITKLSEGSLIIDYNIEFDKKKNPEYENEAKRVVGSFLKSNLIHGNLTVPVLGIQLKGLDMILTTVKTGAGNLEIGLDKEFSFECMYNRTDKTERLGTSSIKICHKPKGAAKYFDIASIVQNMWVKTKNQLVTSDVQEYKNLGSARVTGLLTKDGGAESFIKMEWIYPKKEVVGTFKCIVQTMDEAANSHTITKTIEVESKDANLSEVIEKVTKVDLAVDELRKQVHNIDSRNLHVRERLIKKQTKFMDTTYLLARNLWGNTISAQTICHVNGAYLVEIDNETEWDGVKASLLGDGETDVILAGATNSAIQKEWAFMRNQKKATYFDWAADVDVIKFSPTKRCLAFKKMDDKGWKMTNVECSGMKYQSFMCEQPTK